ncbi:GNAT family N-acetyltransferase [Microbaculum marinisediminis]|uniref:GNAT family N-acetyltransferase n=1 Tax=Microbaculum marinisediminis TaxID=2931392 RepID=A0AAW5R184_9HYPH|nr:GNAT family N-acetyltransferase [Microbaculum sp. A6E488]MCT8974046.1 GNAT family N-acetyltransferase [Microbaculum sp. A6E488]
MTEIRTERLVLRPYRADEADLLGLLLRDRRVVFWQTERVTERDVAGVLTRSLALRPRGLGWFAAFRHDDGRFVGNAILQPLDGTEEIEIGYHLVPEAWGKGYAREAAAAVLDYGFQALRLPRIVAVVLPENARSQRVLERLGLPYIEDRIHAGHLHRYHALSRADYLAGHENVAEPSET